MYSGDFDASDIVDIKFTTVNTSGVPTQLAGTPVVSIYKDNSTSQSTSGVTLTVDFDSVTGLNHVRIDTSADGTFYSSGSDFHAVVTAGTVGGNSIVGYVVGHFSLRNRASLYPTTAGRTLDVSAGGEAGIDWSNIGSPTTAQTLSGTTVGTATAVTNGVTVSTNNDKTGYGLSASERTATADALLDRDMATGTDSGSASVRTVRQALRSNRNRVEISGGTMTVYKEDDSTASWTATVTTAAGNPINSIDPAS